MSIRSSLAIQQIPCLIFKVCELLKWYLNGGPSQWLLKEIISSEEGMPKWKLSLPKVYMWLPSEVLGSGEPLL